MIGGAAALLLAAFAALAHGQRPAARGAAAWARAGWLLLLLSLALAGALSGWRGLMAWCGFVPLAGAAIMLARRREAGRAR